MELARIPIHDSPTWNYNVDGYLKERPIYLQQDHYNHRGHYKNLHTQPGLEINISHEGRAAMVVGDQIYMQSLRHLILFPGQVPHQVFPDDSTVYSRTVICLKDSWLDFGAHQDLAPLLNLQWLGDNQCRHFELNLQSYSAIVRILQKMKEELYWRRTGWERMMVAQTLELITWVQRSDTDSLSEDRKSSNLVRICCDYIDTHLCEDLSLQSMSRLFSVSAEHLTRIFRKQTGAPFHRYVMLRRILESKRKLKQQPNLSLTEIAFSLGFTSSTQFSKTFKSFIGETPSEFRQNN